MSILVEIRAMRLLYVDIDSLRPDHLGCYGYDRETSPTIDRLAETGVRFDRCFASDAPCLPSRTALATCRYGIKTGVTTHFGSGQWYDEPGEGHAQDHDRPLAFRLLSEAGVHTATITSFAKRHLAYHFTAGFRESIQPTAETGSETVEDVTEVALEWLDANAAADDWLLHVNYWDVHHPYGGLGDVVDEVRESGPPADWPDQAALDDQQGMTGVRCADLWENAPEGPPAGRLDHGGWGMPARFETREDVDHLVDGYDASIRRVDAAVERLLNALERAGVREETAVVVSADHGEALGEHGIYAEHAFPHPPSQRVPMIVSWPGVTDATHGECVEEFVHQFDLLPAICEHLGIDVPAGWDAESLRPALVGDGFEGREHVVCGNGIYTFGRAVYHDSWVYIRLLDPGVFAVPGLYNDPDLPGDGLGLLHDLDADPHMTENLIGDRPTVARDMRARMDRWVAATLESPDAAGTDPLVRMARESGPYLYTDVDALEALYEGTDRTAFQRAALERRHQF
jgi:arylsulfatase A-like enzyme